MWPAHINLNNSPKRQQRNRTKPSKITPIATAITKPYYTNERGFDDEQKRKNKANLCRLRRDAAQRLFTAWRFSHVCIVKVSACTTVGHHNRVFFSPSMPSSRTEKKPQYLSNKTRNISEFTHHNYTKPNTERMQYRGFSCTSFQKLRLFFLKHREHQVLFSHRELHDHGNELQQYSSIKDSESIGWWIDLHLYPLWKQKQIYIFFSRFNGNGQSIN